MKLTYSEKRDIESVMISIILENPAGINTRTLITNVQTRVRNLIPNANCHHIAGMIAWVVEYTNCYLKVRTPGYSIIV